VKSRRGGLVDSYRAIKPAIVAIADVSSFNFERMRNMEAFPPIFGTGVMIDARGVVLTNAHVVDHAVKIHNDWEGDEDAVAVFAPIDDGHGWGVLAMGITRTRHLDKFYNPPLPPPAPARAPDLGLLFLNTGDVPVAKINYAHDTVEGEEVAFAGFPFGERLMAEDWIGKVVQLGPTLRRATVAALLPRPPIANAYLLLLDAMSQAGSSGSPVFDTRTGEMIGLLRGGVQDPDTKASLGLCYAVPGRLIRDLVEPALAEGIESPPHSYAERVRVEREAAHPGGGRP
jgi:S1-C subfamily serine protease